MRHTTRHDFHGDRILLTLEVDSAVVTETGDRIAVTMDDEDWRDAERSLRRERGRAERELDGDQLATRFEVSLQDAITRALSQPGEPELLRRRSVAAVLQRLGDMVMGGSVREFSTSWESCNSSKMLVLIETGSGEQTRSRTLHLTFDVRAIDIRAVAESRSA